MSKQETRKKKTIRLGLAALTCGLILSLPVTPAYAVTLVYDGAEHTYTAAPVGLIIDGKELTSLPMPPIILNDLTLVPVRESFEAMGAAVAWQEETRKVLIAYGGRTVTLEIDNATAEVDGFLKLMTVPPKIINDKTMVPIRFVSESLGMEVGWDEANRMVSIWSRGVQVSTPSPLDYSPTPTPTPTEAVNPVLPTVNPAEFAKDVSTTEISTMTYPETKITGVIVPSGGGTTYTIKAASAISRVEKLLLEDNRIVIDIYGAAMDTPQTEWLVDNGVIEKIRIGQNQVTPVKITRVVFDLKAAAAYGISISQDRTEVYVSFQRNYLNNIGFSTDGISDYLKLYLENQAVVNVMTLTNPDRVVIDLPTTELVQGFGELDYSGRYTLGVRVGQFEQDTARVVIDTTGLLHHSVSVEGNVITLKLSEPTFRNILYNSETQVITIDKKNTAIPVSGIVHTDNYNDKKYILSLPVDIEGIIGYGEYKIGDDYLRSIHIQNNQKGLTDIILDEKRINAVNVYEDANNLYIQVVSPREKYSRIVIVDPGHGGSQPGVVANNLQEKDINLDISRKLINLIEQGGQFKVYATRTGDTTVALLERPEFGNEIGDLFVSIHANSGDQNTAASGTEVFFYEHDFDNYIGIRSEEVAKIMLDKLTSRLGFRYRKYEHNNLAVLRASNIPAVLIETGFVTNPEEAAKLASAEYRQKAAEAIYEGLVEVFGKYTPKR